MNCIARILKIRPKNKVAKDQYILALEYGDIHQSFTLGKLAAAINLSEAQIRQMALQIHQHQIFNHDANDYINTYKESDIALHFSVEDKFRLLNYIALQEARASSNSANRHAIIAMGISFLSLLLGVYSSYVQINSVVNIPNDFISKFDQTMIEQSAINRSTAELLKSISKQQEIIIKNQARK